jgi:hypothetical protein
MLRHLSEDEEEAPMRWTWTLAAAAALSISCAAAQHSGGAESPVRLDTQAAVGWEPGGPFNLDLTIYNATGYRIMLVQPFKESLQVKVFRASDGKLMCKTPSPTHKTYEGWFAKDVRAASGLRLLVDVWPYCRQLPQGVYRYEAVFLANPATGMSNISFTGTVGPQGGRIAVAPGVSTDETALAAALAAADAEVKEPAAEGAAASGEPAAAAPEKPAGPVNPEAIRACVDRELAARGLNAYGDPQGTRYDDRPPVDEGGRVLYVASRSPEIRIACRIPGF